MVLVIFLRNSNNPRRSKPVTGCNTLKCFTAPVPGEADFLISEDSFIDFVKPIFCTSFTPMLSPMSTSVNEFVQLTATLQPKNSCFPLINEVYFVHIGGEGMSTKDKLIRRLKSKPKDFTFGEAKVLLGLCGYTLSNAGKTSGSRVCFVKDKKIFRMHKPHQRKELLDYQLKELIDELKQEGFI